MRIGIFGTGIVGETIGSKLVSLGHEVRLGGREKTNEKGQGWAEKSGELASYGTFEDAASFGEIVFNCTKGEGAVPAVRSAKGALSGKILVDVSNPLDFSGGFPPTLFVSGRDSLGEQIQREAPDVKVVKSLNTVNCGVMVEPGKLGPDAGDMFVCGNDVEAKAAVTRFLRDQFGWKSIVDLGDLTQARGTEAYLLLWIRLYGAMKTADFNVKIVRP